MIRFGVVFLVAVIMAALHGVTSGAGLGPLPLVSVALADDGDDGGGDNGGGDDGGGDDGGGDDGGDDGDGDDGGGGDDGGDDDGRDDDGHGHGTVGGGEGGGDDSSSNSDGGGDFDFLLRFFDELLGDGRDIIEDEIIAFGQPDLTSRQRSALNGAGFVILSEHALGAIGGTLLRFSLPSGLDAEDALDLARELVPDALFDFHDLFAASGIGCADCWGAKVIQIERLSGNTCRRGAPIAIIDAGVQSGHPTLSGARITTRTFLQADEALAFNPHGTAIAALLVGESAPGAAPLAPGAHVLSGAVFRRIDDATRADAVAVLRALNWAMRSGARVVAMSLAGAENRVLHRGIQVAARRANFVAAAGNAGPHADPAFPAAFPEVIATTALDARLRAYRDANRGDYVELAAPGVGIVSAAGDGARKTWSGTSFAVPFVAAALLRARAETGGDPEAARALLAASARDLGARGRDPVYGHGLVQSPGERCW